ncbi:MAG: (d)CMP kinase [Candidatus Limnocylindrales bacterium]
MSESPARQAGERGLVVSLDGPASSGKSSVGSAAARRLGYRFCDTGLLYRAVTWLALERGVDPADEPALVALVPQVTLAEDSQGRLTHVRVEDADVTHEVHGARVDRQVSLVARVPGVRAALRPRQRELAGRGRIIMAGRDIGTVILPDADLKLYLDVSVEERAQRRAHQRGAVPGTAAYAAILDEMRARDALDRERAVAPLRVPQGALVIRSDGCTFHETVARVVATIRAAAKGASVASSSPPSAER